MIDEKDIKKFSVLFLALFLVVLSFIVLRPIILAILAGLLLAYVFNPVYKKFLTIFREKNTTAFMMCLLILIFLFLPLWFLVPIVVKQVFDVYLYTQQVNVVNILKESLPSLFSSETFTREFGTALNNFISKSANLISSSFSDLLVNIPSLILQMVVVLFVFFFTLRDASLLAEYMKNLSPLNKDLEENLVKQFKDITFGVIYGQIIVGIIQGALAGIGLVIFGVPQALLLTIVAMFAATIPFIGPWLVWLPAAFVLISTGKVSAGIGLLIYGAVFVSWIDNVIRPYIISKRAKVHSVVIFVGMIGGLIIFGVLGIFLGPLILSYLLILIDLYKQKRLFA